ncbi:MAG: hypothetical protein J6J18_09330 [Oscillospiraceae bacterium]|nr:hypothetical protein [Oscillospiraceae bacterium]
MAGYVLVGMLAAFGIFCSLWVILGWLLPGGKGGVLVCWGNPGFPEKYFVQRYIFLWETGLIRCNLLVVDLGLDESDIMWLRHLSSRIRICTPEELPSGLELERKRIG